jgi:hypothetical protein
VSVWLLVLSKLRVAGAWCKAHWQWVLPPVALLVWYFTRSKNVTVEGGAIVGHDVVVADADRKAATEEAAVNSDASAKLKQAAKDQASATSALDNANKVSADNALVSPEATNEFLKDVSSGMRK